MEYWEKRFLDGGKIWGEKPSKTAIHALELFQRHDVNKILVLGAGYGRNTKLFTDANLEVVGIEVSESAIKIARNLNPKTQFFHGSVLDMPFDDVEYDCEDDEEVKAQLDEVLLSEEESEIIAKILADKILGNK